MPIPLPLLRALDSYTRTIWNLGFSAGNSTILPSTSKSELFFTSSTSTPFLNARLSLLSQLEGGQPAPESPKKPAPFIASASMPASPTNHPDILRADIADLLTLISEISKRLPIPLFGDKTRYLPDDEQSTLARCRAHIQEL